MKRNLVAVVVLLFSLAAFAVDQLRDYMTAQTKYWGIDQTISKDDFNKLVDLKQKADAPSLTTEQRTQAYTDLFQFVQKVRGFPEGKVSAAMAASNWTEGVSPIPTPTISAKPNQLGNFQKKGTGKIPMILIPDLGADWSVYDSFMQRNNSQFTFYAVTLPGFGGTAPPHARNKLDFGAMRWWNNAETAILDLITKQKIDHPFILGHQAGSYLAMKLAIEKPQFVRGAIVLNGLLYAEIPGIEKTATHEQRSAIANSWTPVELFPTPSQERYRSFIEQGQAWFCKDKAQQAKFAELASKDKPSTWWNYFGELATTNLSNDIKSLKVPMLVLPSVHDKESPGFQNNKVALDQWRPLDHSVSSLPITVVSMEDCRAYATEDQPQKLDEVIRNWTSKL
jgi:pimeloyl-ACP methyl ester carboxylesterase